MAINYKYKDTLCRLIFKDKKNLLSLYNALNHSQHTNVDDLTITTLEDVIYLSYKNDLSFLIYDQLFLVEHQSTLNPNMAIRSFLYFARLYEGIIDKDSTSIYSTSHLKLPRPRSYVLYNGEKETEEVTIQRLSDSFIDKDEDTLEEWTCRILNINKGFNKELLETCKPLSEYMYFVNEVNGNKRKGYSLEESIDLAMNTCIKNNILIDLLRKQKAEVKSVCLTEFDQEKYENTIRQEGIDKGIEIGIEQGIGQGENKKQIEMIQTMHSNGMSVEDISKFTNINISYIQNVLNQK